MDQNQKLSLYYSKIYRRYDLVNRMFTFGRDAYWRKETAKRCLSMNPEKVIDICCGTGDLAIAVKKTTTNEVDVTGFDFSNDMISLARIKAERQHVKIDFIQGNVENIPFPGETFDAITIGFGFRNLVFENPKSSQHLKELKRILKKDGRIFILESSVPENFIVKLGFQAFLKIILIPLGGLISGDWKAYRYLAESSSKFFRIDEIERMLNNSGMKMISSKKFFFGAARLVEISKI